MYSSYSYSTVGNIYYISNTISISRGNPWVIIREGWLMSEDIWKPAPNHPGFEINQKGQLRGYDLSRGIWVPPQYKEEPYKPFQGDEWPDHDYAEIPENFI